MARKRAVVVDGRPGKDLGPAIRHVRIEPPPPLPPGATELQKRQAKAAIIVVDHRRILDKETRIDETVVTGLFVRGGRTRDPLLFMHRSNMVSKAQWDAAEAFRDDVAIANGARIDQPDRPGVPTPMTNTNWPAEARLEAMRRVGMILASMTLGQAAVTRWAIIDQRSLDEFKTREQMRAGSASALLHEALNILIDRYQSKGERHG